MLETSLSLTQSRILESPPIRTCTLAYIARETEELTSIDRVYDNDVDDRVGSSSSRFWRQLPDVEYREQNASTCEIQYGFGGGGISAILLV